MRYGHILVPIIIELLIGILIALIAFFDLWNLSFELLSSFRMISGIVIALVRAAKRDL